MLQRQSPLALSHGGGFCNRRASENTLSSCLCEPADGDNSRQSDKNKSPKVPFLETSAIFALMTRVLFVLLILTPQAFAAQAWDCEKPYWIAEPEIEEGMFQAAIGGSCTVRLDAETSTRRMLKVFHDELEKSGKYTIHTGPTAAEHDGMKGVRYDLTDPVSDPEGKVKIRQNVFLGSDDRSRILYETESTQVIAEGAAGYLKKVTFSAKMNKVSSGLTVHFANSVWVERPWMVFNFIFKPMGRKITEEKFELARQKLLEHFLETPKAIP